jgi:acyl phosphate:glycerol-3-phosphate acyltransferase
VPGWGCGGCACRSRNGCRRREFDVIAFVLAALIGYALGMLNPASIVARFRGIDLRFVGSGNPGATNVGRALGPRWAIVVGFLDIAKGFLPAWIFTMTVGLVAGEIAGAAAVLGHVTSPLLKGRGGKGVATALGAILGATPWLAIPVLLAFGIGVLVLRRVGLASVLAAVALSIAGIGSVIWTIYPPSAAIFATVIAVIVVARHADNLRRADRPQQSEPPSTDPQ